MESRIHRHIYEKCLNESNQIACYMNEIRVGNKEYMRIVIKNITQSACIPNIASRYKNIRVVINNWVQILRKIRISEILEKYGEDMGKFIL